MVAAIKLIKLHVYAPTSGKNFRSKKNGVRIMPYYLNNNYFII